MTRSGARLRAWARLPHVRIAACVITIYYVAAWVIFRDVLLAIPDVLAGRSVVVGDELVPYFNPTSQLLDQAKGEYSQLTNGYEFRVRYSFLTTWLRHYMVLPFAILLILPTIVTGAYLTTAIFMAKVFRNISPTTIYLGTGFTSALIYMIAIYAKVTHFYTLVLGLWLMTVSAFIMVYALLFRERKWARLMAVSCAVTLMNPAVHYLILFALFLSISVATLLLGEFARWVRRGGIGRLLRFRPRDLLLTWRLPDRVGRTRSSVQRFLGSTTGRCAVAMTMLAFVAMLPYALFVKYVALRGVPNLSETVPGDYYFIRDASVSGIHVLSWDLAGIMDKIQFGDYLAKEPRTPNIAYTLLVWLPLLIRPIRRTLFRFRAHRQLAGLIFVNVSFAMWATVGYGEPSWLPTFHRSLAATTRTLHGTDTPVGDLALMISSTVVQVLRFPHRFQLILFMLGPLLMAMPIVWAVDRLHRFLAGVSARRSAWTSPLSGADATLTRLTLCVAVGTLFFGPFFANEPYRHVFGSGNFADFATAYPVRDLKELKRELLEQPGGKTVVLPPTETAKMVVDPNGVPHKFIDKFYIYYLDEPSFYYGLTGDSGNKFEFFLMLRSLYYQQDWWINIARDIGLEYLVLNKQVENNRGVGAEYLPDIESYLREQLEFHPDQVTQLFENDSFVLYRLEDAQPTERPTLLFDTSWSDFLDVVFARLDLSRCYDLEYISKYEGTDPDAETYLIASDGPSAALDIWAIDNPGHFFTPSSKIFAFNPDVVASSYYLSPMFRLFLFFSDTKWNRTEMITPGIFGTLRGSFIGVPRSTRFTVPVTITEPGRYRVLMRSANTANVFEISAPSLGIELDAEFRSPPDALQFFTKDQIYESDRVPSDISGYSATELETMIPSELVPVNLRYVFHDLGVVDAAAGLHTVRFDKLDANPMLMEGLVLVPEADYQAMATPPSVTTIEDINQLDCAERSAVRSGVLDGTLDGVGNDPNVDLSFEEMMDLIGVDFRTADPGGLDGRARQVVLTALILLAALAVLARRSTHRVRRDDDETGRVDDNQDADDWLWEDDENVYYSPPPNP